MSVNMPVGVYKVVKLENKQYTLVLNDKPYLDVPKHIYGKSANYALHFYNTFKLKEGSLGVLLTGIPGSGKSELANMIGNLALKDNMYVVIVSNINGDLELAELIEQLDNAIIIFDEFGKMFPVYVQENMLTMFSNSLGGKKMFILTENDKNIVSRFIRDRPGRIRYHIEFDRVERDVIDEYCTEKNVSEEFYNDLLKIYERSTIFSFDHLQTLVSEHKITPDKKLSELIKILNLKTLGSVIKVVPAKAYKVDNDNKIIKEYNVSSRNRTLTKYDFDNGQYIYMDLKEIINKDENSNSPNPNNFSPTINIRINNDSVIKIENDIIYCKDNDIIIELNLVDSN